MKNKKKYMHGAFVMPLYWIHLMVKPVDNIRKESSLQSKARITNRFLKKNTR